MNWSRSGGWVGWEEAFEDQGGAAIGFAERVRWGRRLVVELPLAEGGGVAIGEELGESAEHAGGGFHARDLEDADLGTGGERLVHHRD